MSYLRSVNVQKVEPAKLGVDNALLDLLYEIAFYGMCRSYFDQSEAILTGYFAVKPESERLHIAMGLYCISVKAFEDAVKIFRDDVLKSHPDSDYAKAFLGMAYKNLKKTEDAKKVLNEVITSNRIPEAVVLAKALLEEMKTTA